MSFVALLEFQLFLVGKWIAQAARTMRIAVLACYLEEKFLDFGDEPKRFSLRCQCRLVTRGNDLLRRLGHLRSGLRKQIYHFWSSAFFNELLNDFTGLLFQQSLLTADPTVFFFPV